ncbi:hypothetical protein [Poseidonibacter lekithochrous]|uniref:hypothetical protein n=1 Tax=Poseidonibacter lekithochrous TaxID=1904463 RepID=UPI0008FC81A1|nr:hypothetical protein [Poseidonibacter lekithochrous]QKJ22273.1 hypothetical protein ALEK_0992 [Poseidonibacter lekithochrous]
MNELKTNIEKYFTNDLSTYAFSNYPRDIKKDYYFELRDKISRDLIHIDGILSVYSMGNVGAPGISDLDFLIVVENDFSNKKLLEDYFSNLTDLDKYIAFVHYPFIAFEDNINNVLKILPLSNLNYEQGKKYDFSSEISENENITILSELSFLFYPNLFINILLMKNIDFRQSIQLLNAFRFPLEFILKYNEIKCFKQYIEKLDKIKASWKTLDKEELKKEIIILLKEALFVCYILIDEINKKIECIESKNIDLPSFNVIILNNYNHIKSLTYTVNIYYKYNRLVKFLPLNFIKPYTMLSENNSNIIFEYNTINMKINRNSEFMNRNKLYSDYSNNLTKNNLEDFVPYPFFFKNKKTSILKKVFYKIIKRLYK